MYRSRFSPIFTILMVLTVCFIGLLSSVSAVNLPEDTQQKIPICSVHGVKWLTPEGVVEEDSQTGSLHSHCSLCDLLPVNLLTFDRHSPSDIITHLILSSKQDFPSYQLIDLHKNYQRLIGHFSHAPPFHIS